MENLKVSIRKNIIEANEQKKEVILESSIIERRLKPLLENVNFEKKNETTKLFDNLIYEISYLQDQGFNQKLINEEVDGFFGVLKNLVPSLFGGLMDTFQQRFAENILDRLGVPEGYLYNLIVTGFKNIEMEDISTLFECKTVTRIVSESVVEAYIKGLQDQADLGGDFYTVLRNSLTNTIRKSEFAKDLQLSLSSIICPQIASISSNLQSQQTKLKEKMMS